MIYVYEGTPGSGKTLRAMEQALIAIRGRPRGVVASYAVRKPARRRDGSENWVYFPAEAMSPARLIEFLLQPGIS